MMRKVCLLSPLMLGLISGCGGDAPRSSATSADAAPLSYPESPREAQIDTYHGVEVADPYRWLENMDEPRVRQWIEAQNALAQPWLEGIPARERIKERLTQLWNYERYDIPVQSGGKYFYLRNDGLQNQSVLYVADSLDAQPRVLLDPNQFSDDATIALGEFEPSPDGKLLAYSLSDGGTDWRTWHFRDVATGKDLPDVLRFMKFVRVAWTADSKSVYYTRYPQQADGSGDGSSQRELYWHRLGANPDDDQLIYKVTDHPTRNPYAQVSADGRYLVIWMYDGSDSTGLYYRRLGADGAPAGELVRLIDTFDGLYEFVDVVDDVFYVRATVDAPNAHLLAIPARRDGMKAKRAVIPEGRVALNGASIVDGRIIAQYLQDAHSLIRVFDLQGKEQYDLELPGLGQATGFLGSPRDKHTFYAYTDFLTPATISRLDVASGKTQVFRAPGFSADTSAFVTEQVFYESKDGTQVPMFITRKKDLPLDGSAPTMLYGYGGFNIALQPAFSVPVLVWLEMGGVYAVANLRGGSEYGEAWHSAGTRLQKQNVFDDFIAAGEWLIDKGYTSSEKLAVSGRSNGGLLVGAVITQRPELFGAALPGVGVLDMLRYHTPSANARQWSSDYGLSEDEDEFRAQYAYSPVHNTRAECYPPTLITTADRDDRVVPWHSYKFAAAMQHDQQCANPVLLRVETRAGHGAGKPVWMQVEDFADQWAFLVKTLGMPQDTLGGQ